MICAIVTKIGIQTEVDPENILNFHFQRYKYYVYNVQQDVRLFKCVLSKHHQTIIKENLELLKNFPKHSITALQQGANLRRLLSKAKLIKTTRNKKVKLKTIRFLTLIVGGILIYLQWGGVILPPRSKIGLGPINFIAQLNSQTINST